MPSAGAVVSTTIAAALLLTWGVQHANGQPAKDGHNPHPVRPALWEIAGRPPDPVPSRADRLAAQLRKERQQVKRLKRALAHDPEVNEAIRLASFIYRVPESTLRALSWCESRNNPRAVNGSSGAAGLLQFLPSTWAGNWYGRHGFSVFSPYANALGAAQHISRYGTGAWECAR